MHIFDSFDLFDFYRFLLAVVVGSYGVVRLAVSAVQWFEHGGMIFRIPVLRRYLLVLLLRTPLRRLLYEGTVIGGLVLLLVLLLRLHWR